MPCNECQQTRKTEAGLVIIPGEGRGPSKLVYLKRALNDELAWFDKYPLKNLKTRGNNLDHSSVYRFAPIGESQFHP